MNCSQISAQRGPLNKALSPELTFINRIRLQLSSIIPKNFCVCASTNYKLISGLLIGKPVLQILLHNIYFRFRRCPLIWNLHEFLNVIKHVDGKYMRFI
nr:hypothetical protein Iba_scaffold14943CG0010 [Ipomoea batatas]